MVVKFEEKINVDVMKVRIRTIYIFNDLCISFRIAAAPAIIFWRDYLEELWLWPELPIADMKVSYIGNGLPYLSIWRYEFGFLA